MLKFYNTLSGKEEEFKPLNTQDNVVTMYNCGPTVYNYCHIGNFRSFLLADLIRRTLELNNFKVKQVMNITDVGHMTEDDSTSGSGEDKMAAALTSKPKKGKFDNIAPKFNDPYELANYYTQAFMEDMTALNFRMPHVFPKATDHIKEMVTITEKLIEKNYAYKADDGTVYFDIQKFPGYGKLSNNTLENLQSGAGGRVSADTIQAKKSPHDFSLWKLDEKHIMKWETTLGTGYPGWHIECSAMSMKHLGEQIDIHTGGEDNKFPHHECEIAQTEAYTGKKFVNYWIHGKHLMVDKQKMSKSKGNFYTVREIFEKGYHPLAIRWVLMSTHFMKSLNFTLAGVEEAHAHIRKLVFLKNRLEESILTGKAGEGPELNIFCADIKNKFLHALNDNLNLSKAISEIFIFLNKFNSINTLAKEDSRVALELMKYFDQVLGVIFNYEELKKDLSISEDAIDELVNQRNSAKANKDWVRADQIRDELKKNGITIKDGKEGTTWEATK